MAKCKLADFRGLPFKTLRQNLRDWEQRPNATAEFMVTYDGVPLAPTDPALVITYRNLWMDVTGYVRMCFPGGEV